MKLKWLGLVAVFQAWVLCCAAPPAPVPHDLSKEDALGMLEMLEMRDSSYSCQAMVEAVNGLRHLGKDEALKVLRKYYSPGSKFAGDHDLRELKIICVCRVLFVHPKDGWKEPWFDDGSMRRLDSPGGRDPAAKKPFPLYPVVMSDGVPFLLIDGWMRPQGFSAPVTDEGKRHLDRCEALDLIPKDLPTTGYAEAAKKLADRADFDTLTKGDTMSRDWILNEAERKPVFLSKPPATGTAGTTTSPKL